MRRKDLESAFRRFVNVLRFAPAGALGDYQHLAHLHATDKALAGTHLDCLLAQLADAECERRGMFYSWPYADVERMASMLLDEIDLLAAGKPPAGNFQQAMSGLQNASIRPLAGCAQCSSPCQYRFDVAESEGSQDFKERFMHAPVEWNSLAGLCLSAAASIPLDSIRDRQEAALCFGILQLNALEISPNDQQRGAKRLARSLSLEVKDGEAQRSAGSDG